MRPIAPALLLGSALLLGAPGCGGGGGADKASIAAGDEQVVVSSGAREIASDTAPADIVSASERGRLGISKLGRTWSLTTPASAAIDIALSGIVPGSRGTVSVRIALAGGTSGSAAQDLRAAGLSVRSGNLIDRGAWLESVGDGFARVTLSGAIGSRAVLVLEREVGGKRTHGAIELEIGPAGPANPSVPGTTAYGGIKSSSTIYSSDAPIFGLPAIAGNGDRVSLASYDAVYTGGFGGGGGGGGVGPAMGMCVMPDVERRQRRFQLDIGTGAKTMGETLVLGNDATSWRDTEIAGLFNVIAVAQSGGEGVTLALSLDRGATFPLSTTFDAARWSRLVQVTIGEDYSLGLLFWSSDVNGALRLMLVEGRPSSLDAALSPAGYAFDAPAVLLETTAATQPLVSDLRYTSCGDLFVAYGCMETTSRPTGGWIRTTRVGCFRRLAGTTEIRGPAIVDEMEIVGFDPSIAVLGCGDTAQVFIAYEAESGVRIARSTDGGRTFPGKTDFGTNSANAPQIFARVEGAKNVLDCVFVDGSADSLGWDLCLLRVDDDLVSGRGLHRILVTKLVAPPGGGPPTEVEGLGWMGFDATTLAGDLFVAVHTQRTQYYAPGVGFRGAGGGVATVSSAPAAPPAVLYPGMTEPVPAVDPAAQHKLGVIRLE